VCLIGKKQEIYRGQTFAHPANDRESAEARIENSNHCEGVIAAREGAGYCWLYLSMPSAIDCAIFCRHAAEFSNEKSLGFERNAVSINTAGITACSVT